jgi:N-carbamoyl-L-amino-acid hydrolase
MDRAVRDAVTSVARRFGLEPRLAQVLDQPAVPFDPACVDLVRAAAAREALPHMDIVSGAAHDAMALARVVPAAMVFVPCAGGISHNEAESATPEDLAAGCQVLLDAMVARAGA